MNGFEKKRVRDLKVRMHESQSSKTLQPAYKIMLMTPYNLHIVILAISILL